MKRKGSDCSKKATKFYFELKPGEVDRYQCKYCPNVQRVQKAGTGYSNLMSHITVGHPNFEEEIKCAKEGKLGMPYLLFVVCFYFAYQVI